MKNLTSVFGIELAAVAITAALLIVACGGGSSATSPPPALAISPSGVTLPAGGAQSFTATVTGSSNQAVTWMVQEGAAGGTITSAGVYTAPQVLGTYHVIATSQADSTKSATATVTVPSPSVTISPKTVTMGPGGTLTFMATVTGLLNQAVTWTVQEGAAGGVITTGGVYTAPQATGVFHVIATSVADPTKNDTAAVTITILPISVSIIPLTDTLGPESTRTFTGFASNSSNQAVTWAVQEGAAGGAITNAGVYTAPATVGTFHVVATSVADPSKNAVATVTLVPAGFKPTGRMWSVREEHTGTLLNTGKVLMVGGEDPCCGVPGTTTATATAELYDPATGSFAPTGSMGTVRSQHTATLLPNGKVLVAGGLTGVSCCAPATATATAELYDPATGSFAPTGSMGTVRIRHTATLLPNGKVLVAGGFGVSCCAPATGIATAELYDPATGSFAPTGSMGTARFFTTATALLNGKVLIAGGISTPGAGDSMNTAELYDPATGSFAPTGSMGTARSAPTATLLRDGKVLVAGGGAATNAELYDPATASFTPTGSMGTVRSLHTATLLPNGAVLVAGGSSNFYVFTAELYDPVSGTFAATGSMGTVRFFHTAVALQNGKVLVAGGDDGSVPDGGAALASAELYQ